MRLSTFLQITLLFTLLAACGGQPPSGAAIPSPPPAPTGAPAAPTQAPAPTSAPSATEAPAPTDALAPTAQQPSNNAAEALVTLSRSGGIAGVSEIMTVYADGRLEFSGDVAQTAAQATPSELATLRQLLASPEFAALDARYAAMGADLFIYEISLPGSRKTVVTMDGAPNPPVLEQVLAELQQLMQRSR